MKCFKSRLEYYRITGDPQAQKLCPTSLVLTEENKERANLLKLLKPRLEWQNNYEARIVTVRLVINRLRPGTFHTDSYTIEYTNVYVEKHGWCNARQRCLLKLWMKIKNPNG